jgi:hypothetical protein
MAHPDHDQVIGRLVGARLRSAAAHGQGRAVPEAHPDAETWAAYVDGGLGPDEVTSLEAHLGGCAVCRRLVAALAPEVSVAAAPGSRDAEVAPASGAVVIPFPRRRVFGWMALAAGLFGAVTLWSVSRLGNQTPDAEVAQSISVADAPAPTSAAGPVAPPPADPAKPLDRVAAAPPPAAARGLAPAAPAEQDKGKADARRDMAFREGIKASEEKLAAEAVPAPAAAANRIIQLQTNSVSAGATHGPVPTQQAANQQQNATSLNLPSAPAPLPVPVVAAPSPPPPAPAAAPATAPVQADAAAAAPRERPGNEQPVGQLAETVTITGGRAEAARRQSPRGAAAGSDRDGQARAKDEVAKRAAFSATEVVSVAMPMFAEPGGRLQWRIAEGRRIESSSDGGATWNRSHTARHRLRAGTAPSIDSAWAVGERGLVLRLVVPGGWSVAPPPATVTLVGVSATDAQHARVTAEDGRVFETADGGTTWTAPQ